MNNIIGQKFGKLVVIEEVANPSSNDKYKKYHKYYLCRCECGKTNEVKGYHLIDGNTKSCGCSKKRRGSENPKFKGFGDLSMEQFSRIKYSIKIGCVPETRDNEKEVTIEYLWNLFTKQGGICALSGLPIYFDKRNKEDNYKRMNKTASLDRIDSLKGYIEGNVQWVHKDINFMKQESSDREFINLCRIVSKYNENKYQ